MERLGRYQIERTLGSGAFATVYLAEDQMLKRKVALKVLKPLLASDEETRQRFLREAQVLANLQHPHLAGVWDIGEDAGQFFIALRYIHGQTLEQVLKERGTLPWEEALQITRDIAEALQYAHDKGFVHRDVKPGNIIINAEDGAVLTDFGLVKALSGSRALTQTGLMMGTPEYMATEIMEGLEASPASDQFSLACVLVEMLTGASPYAAPTPMAVMAKHARAVVLPEQWGESTPLRFVTVLRKGLETAPADRFASVSQFVKALIPSTKNLSQPTRTQSQPNNMPVHLSVAPAPKISSSKNEMSIPLQGGLVMEFVQVPAGEFTMGSENGNEDGKPVHKVYLDEYWMGKYPVTNEQYKAYVRAGGTKPLGNKDRFNDPAKTNHPVENISWNHAQRFCLWLSEYNGKLITLPTEAQWEKAARGTDGRTYPWGNQAPTEDLCNYNNNLKDTSPVNQYPAGISLYDCYDMTGNVWEWCMDWYDQNYYKNSSGQNPAGPGTGIGRVLRGGSWNNNVNFLRVVNRGRGNPNNAVNTIGLRCVLIL